jgi:serine/threonine-protein kinase RsbW
VLVVAHLGAYQFETDERDFLHAVSVQGAQALERARLYREHVALAETTSFFARAARAIAEGRSFADTLERLANLALPGLGDICLIDVVGDDGGLQRMVARHRDPARQHLVDRLGRDYPLDPERAHPALDVIRTGETRWSPVMTDDFLRETTRDDEHFALVKALDFRSYLAVPLWGSGGVLGCLTLVSAGRPYLVDDVRFAERLAEHVAVVVDNARRHEAASQTSHILQQSLLPRRLPRVAGLAVHTQYLPATRGLEVGGDFYDLVVLPSGQVDFMIGDVAGHDRDAAALMGHLRSAARALAGQVDGPAALIESLQWSWELLGFDRIATGLFARLDPETRRLAIASAGHYPPLLVHDGQSRYLPVEPSVPLGAPASQPKDWQGQLEPGALLLLYTDGAIEERSLGPEASMDRLAAAVAGEVTTAAVCRRVVETLPAERLDDVALLAIQLLT